MSLFASQGWLPYALVLFIILGYFVWRRYEDRRWLKERFGGEEPLAISFGVKYYGLASEPGPPRRGDNGFLAMFGDRLLFRSRRARVELEIPGRLIARIYHDHEHKGFELNTSVIKVDFIGDGAGRDCAAFKVPYPPQWIKAVGETLLK